MKGRGSQYTKKHIILNNGAKGNIPLLVNIPRQLPAACSAHSCAVLHIIYFKRKERKYIICIPVFAHISRITYATSRLCAQSRKTRRKKCARTEKLRLYNVCIQFFTYYKPAAID